MVYCTENIKHLSNKVVVLLHGYLLYPEDASTKH